MTELKRHRFLKACAARFPNAPAITEDDEDSSSLVWERDGMTAGISADEEGAWIFLNNATRDAEGFDEAIAALNAIFNDEIVEVVAYQGDQAVYVDLANADAPAAGFNKYQKFLGGGGAPSFDRIEIKAWSGLKPT